MIRSASLASLLLLSSIAIGQDFSWAPVAPGKATAFVSGAEVTVQNDALKVGFMGNSLRVENKWTKEWQDLGSLAVRLVLRDGRKIDIEPQTSRRKMILAPMPASSRASERKLGAVLVMPFSVVSLKIYGYWRLLLRDGCDYARVEIDLKAPLVDADIRELQLLNFKSPSAQVFGKVPGSPVVVGNFFVGVEHPMSVSNVVNGVVTCAIDRVLPVRRGGTVRYSAVIGVAPKDQMRRAFLSYVESERAHPYRPFLHYNSWYDIGYGNTFNETQCLDRIEKYGTELVEKRGVRMDSFLFDDGWDNYQSIWQFHAGFPHGFLPLKEAAQKYNAGPGVWLSPWGGYGGARDARLAYGKAHGMEVDSQGYALSGPKYYKKFHDVTLDFVTRQGINQFKFDGTGSPDKTTPGSQFDSDFDAAISLIGDLRAARPDLFVNLTTGTWPSPFWLKFADSTWRGGADHSFAGVGTWRQKWMTYRDGDTYHGVVQRGLLYPINSLMVHGIIYARHAQHLADDPGNDFRDDVHAYFANGTQLQELYISPDLLTTQNWDDLAEAAKWSRANADVLVDTHWVGGDPAKLEVYGWAAWSPRKAILTLRNPSDKPQAFSVDIESVLQVPAGFAKAYSGASPWQPYVRQPESRFPIGGSVVVELKPFEVRTYDLAAEKS